MAVHSPSLFLAAAVALFVAAAVSASIGVHQRARRGTSWWLAAHALLVVSLVLQAALPHHDIAGPLAALCALQWPVVMLGGVRRFYSRGAALAPAWADGVSLSVASVAAVGTWLAPFDAISAEQIFALAMLVLTLYVAAAVSRLEDFATTATLKTLLGGLVAAATLQAAWLAFTFAAAPFATPPDIVGAAAMLSTAVIALLTTQLTPAMNHERQIAHLRSSQRKLRHLVDVDPLTKLPNRRHFQELAEKAVKPAPGMATVLVFDVDQLQRINELLGHANGDEALRQIGTAFRETLRRRDVHHGGEHVEPGGARPAQHGSGSHTGQQHHDEQAQRAPAGREHPGEGGDQSQHHGDAGEQRSLVSGSERGYREVLEPWRGAVDERPADRDHGGRRATGATTALQQGSHEIGDADGQGAGEQAHRRGPGSGATQARHGSRITRAGGGLRRLPRCVRLR